MIKQLNIFNFQSHKDSTLDFSDHVNVIIGQSDMGKSVIIRAIRWLATNRPSGDSFRSTWGGKTEVELFTDDAHIIRSKDKENEYILGDTHFKAFSTDVPKEILDALNLNEINCQYQLDPVFLLSETPGAVAQHFNEVANLSKIDSSLQNINSWIRELTSDIKYKEEQVVNQIEELKKFEHLEKFEIEVEVLEQLENQSKNFRNSYQRLLDLCTEFHEVDMAIDVESEILVIEKPLNAILDLIDLRAEKDIEVVKLDRLIVQIEKVQVEIDEQKDLISVEKPVNDLLELYESREIVVERQKGLNKTLSQVNSTSGQLKTAESKYRLLKAEMDKIEICPFCGQKLKDSGKTESK